jgi:hypothetical protein
MAAGGRPRRSGSRAGDAGRERRLRREVARLQVLTGLHRQAGPGGLARGKVARQAVLACPGALGDPDGAGAQDTAELAGAGRVGPVSRAEREELLVVVACVRGAGRCREPVIGIRPAGCLPGVGPGRRDAAGQLGQLVAAALAD